MIDLIFAPENLPFSVALGVMLAIAALEGVGMLFGAGLSGVLESVAPDFDVDIDTDLDADGAAELPALSSFLGWLRVGEVPVLILLIVFLTSFGLGGFIVQGMAHAAMGALLPMAVASVAALGLALPGVRVFGGVLARILPRDETEAVSGDSFIGCDATITLGVARQASPAQARAVDRFGKTHYLMVEPNDPDSIFETGATVRIVERKGARYLATARRTQSTGVPQRSA